MKKYVTCKMILVKRTFFSTYFTDEMYYKELRKTILAIIIIIIII